MNPARVRRDALQRLTDLPNVGPSVAGDLRLLGIELPQQLAGWNAWEMYAALCSITQQQHDPCVIDIFLSLTDFMAGGDPKPWWHYTAQRKAQARSGELGGSHLSAASAGRRKDHRRHD